MDVIQGGGEPDANMHRRMRADCDICGAPLKGRMPKPWWVAPAASKPDERGHPVIGDSIVRVYLCGEHRATLKGAFDSAWRRERDRMLAGQKMISGSSSLHRVD
jgi:hypothetical protein